MEDNLRTQKEKCVAYYARLEVLTAVVMNRSIFWDIMPFFRMREM
jgi:hypothetical protein